MSKIDLNKYKEFVLAVCSDASKDLTAFIDRLDYVDGGFDTKTQSYGPDVNVPLLLTSAIGLAAEAGEFCELPKKIFFQGKQLDEDTLFHMKRELGDVIWYWTNACNALGLDPNDVIAENVRKLEARYPGGKFDAHYSENRKEGDL